ncbi:hypothetical protein PsalN5692_03638 (plasmid) [Piscirickettsia salmonis]|uniref:hypothetical protein n=1 Tax=Piscirickettsia salmonis TaxID=1238 RepID=UPI0012BA2E0E|nr:hypothetical protein [Piscirickettsia salmonis]QGP52130.1 hypothetical protein PsalN5692_03638 [Piscirickettsia salmonis]
MRHVKRILSMLRKVGVILTDSVKTARYSNTVNVITLIPGLGESLYKNNQKQNIKTTGDLNKNVVTPPSDIDVTQKNLDEEPYLDNNHSQQKQNDEADNKPAIVVIQENLDQLLQAKRQDPSNPLIDDLITETEACLSEAQELANPVTITPEYISKSELCCEKQTLAPTRTIAKVTNPCSQEYYHEQQNIHSNSQQQLTNPMSSAYWQGLEKQEAIENIKSERLVTDKHLQRLKHFVNRFGNKMNEMVWFLKNSYLDEGYSIDKVMSILSAIAPRFSKPIQMS